MDREFRIHAPCPLGVEEPLTQEMRDLGGVDIHSAPALVSASGDLSLAYRLCLWSRLASRLLLHLADWPMTEVRSLYDLMLDFPFEQHFDADQTFAFEVTLVGAASRHNGPYLARLAKDGLADRFRERCGLRPSVDTLHPALRFHLHWDGARLGLNLDLAGPLHRRGWRLEAGEAPMKENLAAAVLMLAGFAANSPPALIDPCCGGATLLIEAAMIVGDVAPGLSRSSYGFTAWKQHQPTQWDQLVDEAMRREAAGEEKTWPLFLGFDADGKAVAAARKNIEQAGFAGRIVVEKRELAHLVNPNPRASGLIIANLPYGERLGEEAAIGHFYRAFGRIAQERFSGWRLAVLIGKAELTDSFGLSWQEKIALRNGALPCRLLTGVATAPAPFRWPVATADDDNDFAGRLRKNLTKMMTWAEQQGVYCFRVYDRDLPNYNFSLDLYEKWALLNEYAPPAHIDAGEAEDRLALARKIIRQTLGLRSDRLFIRRRQRQKGKEQYQRQRTDERPRLHEVREGDCRFLINLSNYLDTGLFLDHRPLRLRIAREAKGKRFLNLFAYSGAATVHAAFGGAAATTSVDLSAQYLAWARMNLAINGLAPTRHRFIVADCRAWLRDDDGLYDLIFLDPPTFANSKKKGLLFEVQRHHAELLELAMRRLAPGGLLLFSVNFREFVLDADLPQRFAMREITRQTIPFDFARNPKVHRAWEVRPAVA
ncbi:MAG: bifunctional 23S rRNA (guanine(2069)-N(7))-methyltransferase RlmK/23S rRNA (guanine(2445)-N(2))-methyltransferase RlmL [Desulfobulbaceae bacterium]|jgi:23S rRNA (guanine2445-N2)-methyltransferase / 23S rRNA (guanine2069-N7)-methyltransferase|nr:bifunctional 23S rRNA (guanine(2069)-N(7))-methyltransferase RlmK/23S rRNA (guanine(2445)-N(2))-methyltransferase RlmL [Desulfobulbaceae bacterium]